MRDLRYLDARDVIRAYCAERSRRAEPESLMAHDPEMPRSPSPVPPSGWWEQLCRLMVGVGPMAIRALNLQVLGYEIDRKGEAVHVMRPSRPLLYEADQQDAPWVPWLKVTLPLTTGAIGKRLGVSAREVRRMIARAEATVSENLGRAKRGARSEEE